MHMEHRPLNWLRGASRAPQIAKLIAPVVALIGTAAGLLHAQSTATNVVAGAIRVPGERDAFVFQVGTPSRFYFDALTNNGSLQWSLRGPPGTVVANRTFTG